MKELMETRARKRSARRNLERAILGTVAATGLVAVGMMAPNLPQVLKKLGMLPTNDRDTGVINRARNRMIKKGFLVRTGGFLKLSASGARALKHYELREQVSLKKSLWDGKWRVLMFDIPEHRKRQRDLLRRTLNRMGFLRLQDSAWIFPHDCEEYIALLKADFHIGKDMLYLIVEELESDMWLRRRFGLK